MHTTRHHRRTGNDPLLTIMAAIVNTLMALSGILISAAAWVISYAVARAKAKQSRAIAERIYWLQVDVDRAASDLMGGVR